MRVFKSKDFAKFCRKEGITNRDLCKAVRQIEEGLVDADYGGGVVKQRIARAGQGKSGGHRSILLYVKAKRAFFVHGFSKNAQANISDKDVRYLKQLAKVTLSKSDAQLVTAIEHGIYEEIRYEEK